MPFYEYQCPHCGHHEEVLQAISDKPLKKCMSCGKNGLKKLMSAPVFRLKGSGWYETDFKSDKDKQRNLAGADKDDSKGEAKPEAKADAPADAKPDAAKPDAAKPEATKADTPKSESKKTEAAKPAAEKASKSARKPAARVKPKTSRASKRSQRR